MKKILSRIVAVVLCGVATIYILIHVTYVYRWYDLLMDFYAQEENSLDVVFLGTSVTFSSFMPMDAWGNYGIAACNYCTNVQYENTMKYSLRDIERTQNPVLIMVDIAPFLYGHYAGTGWPEEQMERHTLYNLGGRRYQWDRFALTYEITRDMGGNAVTYLKNFFDITQYKLEEPNWNHYYNSQRSCERGYGYLGHDEYVPFEPDDMAIDDGTEVSLTGVEQEYLEGLVEEAKKVIPI